LGSNRRATIIDETSLRDTFREDVLAGLACGQKAISPKHLYDARGSALFERICEVDDYYPTRTEASIFDESLDAIASRIGSGAVLIEPGAGSGEKAERLLEAMDEPRAFVPVEISSAAVDASADALASRFEETLIAPVCADFTAGLRLPRGLPDGRRIVFFPGSTIGNFDSSVRRELLSAFARAAGRGGLVLIGADLEKGADVLETAYDDSEGVTAAFNLNLLRRINRELEGTFDEEAFEHRAPWVGERSRVEMRLVARRAHVVHVCGERFEFARGEWIHTESSNKFTPARLDAEAAVAGLEPIDAWTGTRAWFRVALYRAAG
jgi:dimethylhistidine N-methyltransferase